MKCAWFHWCAPKPSALLSFAALLYEFKLLITSEVPDLLRWFLVYEIYDLGDSFFLHFNLAYISQCYVLWSILIDCLVGFAADERTAVGQVCCDQHSDESTSATQHAGTQHYYRRPGERAGCHQPRQPHKSPGHASDHRQLSQEPASTQVNIKVSAK